MRRADLEEKFPRLAQTNAPIITPPPMTMFTNRPAPTNRVITLSNVTPRIGTNGATPSPGAGPAAKPGTNAPLILPPAQPAPTTTQPSPTPPKQ
jgi:hypothetical protein